MPYCPRCGVEVEHDITECPLCSFSIPEVPNVVDIKKEEIELKNYYAELRELKKLQKKRGKAIAFTIIILAVIFVGFNNAMQDWYGNGRLTFSPYVLSSLGLFICILICLFGFIKNWKKIFLFLYITSSAFLFSIDYYNEVLAWFWTAALPISTATFGLVFLVAYIITRGKPGGLNNGGIIFTGIAILIILIELILDLHYGQLKLTWSIQVFITASSLAIIFLLARKIVHKSSFKKLKRFFHF